MVLHAQSPSTHSCLVALPIQCGPVPSPGEGRCQHCGTRLVRGMEPEQRLPSRLPCRAASGGRALAVGSAPPCGVTCRATLRGQDPHEGSHAPAVTLPPHWGGLCTHTYPCTHTYKHTCTYTRVREHVCNMPCVHKAACALPTFSSPCTHGYM